VALLGRGGGCCCSFDEDGSCARCGEAVLVGGDVVDGVGADTARVEDDAWESVSE